jgi:hypothetical protein
MFGKKLNSFGKIEKIRFVKQFLIIVNGFVLFCKFVGGFLFFYYFTFYIG